jgi:hypothetical protein
MRAEQPNSGRGSRATLLWAISCLLLSACAHDAPERVAANRHWQPTQFDTAWTVGGNAADTLLGFPGRLVAADDFVIVTDPGYHRVFALRAADGSVAWINGSRDKGRTWQKPLILAPRSGHLVTVVDERTNRLTTIDMRGRTVDTTALDPARFVNGMCSLEGKDLLVTSTDDRGPLYTLAADGKTTTPVPLSFFDTKGQDPLVLQASFATNRERTVCAVGLNMGGWLALWNGTTFTRAVRYREDVPFPVPVLAKETRATDSGNVQVTYPRLPHDVVQGALDVAMSPGRVRVLFGGDTPQKGRIIDDYDEHTLAYLGSVLLPSRALDFATPTADLIVVITKHNGFPMLVALRTRAGSRP